MATPAIIPVSVLEEDITRHHYDEDVDPQRRPRGKGKEKHPPSPDASSRVGEYPPVNDEQEESRRIQENLKRWEQAELQRRKAARNPSTSSTSSPSSIVNTVSRSASLLWPTKRTKSSLLSHNLGRHAALPSTDNLPLTNIAASPTASPSRSDTDFTPRNSTEDDPFNPPKDRTSSSSSSSLLSPFTDPPATPGADQTSALAASSPHNNIIPAGSQISRQPPPPRPLGLPRPKTPPPPLDSQMAEDDDEEQRQQHQGSNGPHRKTRWWNEWLCGCGEGPDRGGEHQAGKTNPFE